MTDNAILITLTPVTCTAISVVIGVIAYLRQQKINTIQNLITVFQRFAGNDDFLSIFSASDAIYVRINGSGQTSEVSALTETLKNISAEKKI